ncbi:MAG: DivIVA domain-containing protein [Clostridia bacterium]|nr:DivIVA domain-containing protein [Clostridia bacterium]
MVTADEIRNKEFSRAGMSGYKKIEVDVFLDEIVNTINYLTTTAAANEKKIADYELKLNEYKADEQAIQAALVNAERVSEQLISEAKVKADDTVFAANEKANEIMAKANVDSEATISEAKEKAEAMVTEAQRLSKELSDTTERVTRESIETTKVKTEAMVAAAEESVAQQQKLFDELKMQVALFKRDILAQLGDQTKLVSEMPNAIIPEPEVAAAEAEIPATEEVVEEEAPECNDIERIISEMRTAEEEPIILGATEAEIETDAVDESAEQKEMPETDTTERKAPNFKVNIDFDEDETEEEEDSDEAEDDVNINSETERTPYTFNGDVSEISE